MAVLALKYMLLSKVSSLSIYASFYLGNELFPTLNFKPDCLHNHINLIDNLAHGLKLFKQKIKIFLHPVNA